jgi:hypothetical protein
MDQTNRLGFLPNRLTAAGLPSVRSPALAKRSLELITKSERYTRARLMQRLRFIRTVTVEIKDKNGQAVSPTVQTDVFQGDNWYDLLILACHKNDPTLVWRLASATYNDQEFQLPSGHECGVFSGWFIDGAWHEVPDKRYNWLTFGLNWSYGQRVSLTLHTKLPKTLVNPYGLTNNPVAANYLQKSVTKLARELQARIGRGMIEALFKSNKYDFADIAVDPFIKYLNNDRPNRNWPTLKRLCANLAESFRWSSAEDFFCQVAQGKITLAVIEKAL